MSLAILVQGKSLQSDSELEAWPQSDFVLRAAEQTTIDPAWP
jgi:hypothetical protein